MFLVIVTGHVGHVYCAMNSAYHMATRPAEMSLLTDVLEIWCKGLQWDLDDCIPVWQGVSAKSDTNKQIVASYLVAS